MRILAAILFCSLTATSAVAQDVDTGDSLPGTVDGSPVITAVTPRSVPKRAPSSDYTYTYKGVKYTYITENNYTRYFNPSVHKPSDYGWYTDADGWYVNAENAYITAASIDADNFPSSGEVYIVNDLVGFFAGHTHLGCIADNAFRYMQGVRRIYFQATDASANARSLVMMFGGSYNPGEGSGPNAIGPVVRTIDADGTQRVFDLSGRRIDGNVRGIVVKNGKKMVSGRFERSASYKNK